jgi:hypothetical protein
MSQETLAHLGDALALHATDIEFQLIDPEVDGAIRVQFQVVVSGFHSRHFGSNKLVISIQSAVSSGVPGWHHTWPKASSTSEWQTGLPMALGGTEATETGRANN